MNIMLLLILLTALLVRTRLPEQYRRSMMVSAQPSWHCHLCYCIGNVSGGVLSGQLSFSADLCHVRRSCYCIKDP